MPTLIEDLMWMAEEAHAIALDFDGEDSDSAGSFRAVRDRLRAAALRLREAMEHHTGKLDGTEKTDPAWITAHSGAMSALTYVNGGPL